MNQTNQQQTDLTPLSPAETMRHSVFLADTRQVVNTTLRRAEEIRYAADIELAGRSRDNYFALERMDTSVPDMTRSAFGQASKAVFGTGANMVLTLYRELKAGAESAKLAWEKSGEVRAVTDALRMGTMAPERANRELAGIDSRYEKLKSLGRDAMQVMRANHERFLQESGLAKDEQDGFVYDFFGGIATLGAAVAVTAITKSPVAASALFGAYAGRQDYEEALENGVTPGRAMLVGFAGGLAEGGLEHLGLGALEKVFKGKGILRAGLKGFTTEAVQEGSQQTAEEIIMQTFGGREKELQDTFVDITYSALLGGLTGAPVSMVMNFAQKRFEEKGAEPLVAQTLAKIAVEHAGSEPVLAAAHDVLRNVTSPLNYPNADVSQGAKEFGAAVRGAQDRNVRRAVYNVSDRTEQNARAAGYDPVTAELLGQLEQSRANSIYALAGITPGAQMDLTEVRFEKITPEQTQEDLTAEREQWKREYEDAQKRKADEGKQETAQDYDVEKYGLPNDVLFQSAAMYKNSALSLAEFADFYHANKDNPKEQNKSFYRFSVRSGAAVDVPFNRVKHIDKKHAFTKEQWQALENGIDNIEYAYYVPGQKGENNGVQFLCKINTPAGKAGVTLEVLPNGRVLLDTAVFDSEANIDNWAKNEPLQRPSHKKPVLVGSGIDNSIAGLREYVKGQTDVFRKSFDTSNADIYYKEDLSVPAGSNDIFSVPIETAEKFRTDVKNALQDNSIPKGKTLDMGEIPHIYVKLGLPAGRLKTNKTTLLKAIGNTGRHPHNVPVAVLENLPTLLADPKAIFKSSPDSTNPDGFVVVLDAVNEDGKPIVAIISPSKKGGKGFWFIPSVYDRNNFENFVWKTYTEQGIKYIKEKGSDIWGTLQSRPRHNQNLLNSIKTKEDFVKAQAETELLQENLFDMQLSLFDGPQNLFETQSEKEENNGDTPEETELKEAADGLFTQEELGPELPPFKPTQKPERIEDFGEKILGARKDLWGKYKDALTRELPKNAKDITLSQFFPEPNYDAAIAQGITVEQLAAVKALRDSIPVKPQYPGRAARWAEGLKAARAAANEILEGTLNPQVLHTRAGSGPIAQRMDFYMELGYPLFTKAKAFMLRERHGCTFYHGEQFEEPTTIYEFDRGYNTLYGSSDRAAVMAWVRNYLQNTPAKTNAPSKLDVYQRRTGEIVIGKKIASGKYIDLKGGFSRVSEALAFLNENQAHLEALLEEKKKMPPVRRAVNDPRVGKEYRPAGTVVTPERFSQEFGFRGVQFGNWVEQERRAQDLNNAYDALLDMADLIHIPARAVSLDGTLGLAFGARGSSAAAAHYEPGQVVINLTKNKGAGSLAHEWWHALDNYFGRKSGENRMATVRTPAEVRPEMREVFNEVVQTVRMVLGERSKNADKTRAKDYWSTPDEMTARAFEAYLIYKAKEKGYKNDYLANIVSENAFKLMGGEETSYPYPTKTEMPVISDAFDAFFSVLKTAESERGYTLYEEADINPAEDSGDVSFDFGQNAPKADYLGKVVFDKDQNRAVIHAARQANKSTALHEFFHIYEYDLYRAEKVSNEPEFLKLVHDLRSIHAGSTAFVKRYLNKTKLLNETQRAEILNQIQQRGADEYIRKLAFDDTLDAQDTAARFVRRAFRENFATLAEKYFMNGRAPNAAYKGLFERFAAWLREIYHALAGVELSPQVQTFFDTLLTRRAARVDSNLFTGKVEQIKKLVQNIRTGKPEADGAPSLQDFKGLLEMLDAPAPRRPQTHLLKELRRRGAEYKNAGQIDKEAYKNARVYDKKGGVDDRPDVWLQKLGYMDFDETTPETLSEAYDKIQRALDGEEIYPLGAEAQLAEWNNYKAGIDVLKEVFGGNVREIRATLKAILDLEAKGYRVVEQKDLKHMSLRLDELSRLADRLELKTKTAQDKSAADKKTLEAARKIKRNIISELEKRQVQGKGEMVKKLHDAKSFEEIHTAAADALDFLRAAYEQTAEGRAEISRLAVPNTDWDSVKVELLQKYNEVIASADEKLKKAWQTLDEISVLAAQGKILDEAQARAKENAERTVRELGERLDGQYVQAMENTLRNIPHLSPQDVRKFLASYAKKATRYRALNQSQVENFIQTAKNVQEANYKKYMRGKIGAVLSRKTFEKVGTARRAKYTPEALAFLQSAAGTWHGTQESAQQAYEHAVGEIDPNNPPSVWQALENRVLWAKADPGGEVSMADLRALYDDALAAVRGDRAFKRLQTVRQAVREDNLRTALELSLKDRKLPKGTAAYLLHGGTDLQTFIAITFGKNTFDELDPNGVLRPREIDFREELAPETNQIEEANFKARAERDILRAVGDAYGLKTPFQIIDKIAEMQKDTVELTNYAYVKDQENGETVATLFKNGKPLTHNKPRKQTVSRFDALTFWIWNQDHDFVETADGVEDYGLAGRLQYAYGTAQLENLFGRLTPQDIKAAKNLQKLAEKHHAEESLVHQRIYGFPLPKKEFYFPSVTDRTTDEIDMKQEFVQNSKAPSFIKKRVKSKRVIQRVANPVDILRRHLRRAGEFIYNAEKYTELQRVFKQSSMGTAFEEAFGEKDGKKVYAKLLALINQQAPQSQQAKDEFYNAANKLFNGWVKAVMGFKPITGIKQFASSVSFAENMPWSDWAKYFAEGLSKPLETAEFMKRLSPYIQTRYESGGMNEAVARAMASDEISPIASRWNNLTNLMLLNTRLGDKASLIYGGYPYMKYLLDVKKLTPEEAARQFEKQATRTLQSSLRVHLSEGQANADSFAARVFLVFKNQQLQYVRKVAESYAAYKNGEISGAQMAKTAFLYLVLNPMVYTMLGLGFFAVDGDDWGEDLKRLLTSPVSQFFGAYPFGEGVADFFMDNAVSVWKDQKLTVPQKMGLPMFDDIYKDVARMVKTVNADDIAVTDFLPVFLDAAKYTGLPTQTFANMAGGAADLVHGKFARGGLRLAGYTKNRAGKITGEEE